MGHKPLEKAKKKHKKGLWSPDEDQKLRNYVTEHGHRCWTSVPINAGLQRSGKSCRLRWINYLRPGLKRGALSVAEEEKILTLHRVLGNKWSQIAHHLPGRTDNEVKNYWHSYLKKRVAKMTETEAQGKKNDCKNARIQVPELLTCQDSSLESFEQSMQLKELSRGAQKYCSLPKVIFAEWLSSDQFYDQDLGSINYASESKNNFEYHSSNDVDEGLVDGLLVDEGTFVSENNSNTSMEIYIDDMFQSAGFELEYHVSESDVVDYFPGQFCSYDMCEL